MPAITRFFFCWKVYCQSIILLLGQLRYQFLLHWQMQIAYPGSASGKGVVRMQLLYLQFGWKDGTRSRKSPGGDNVYRVTSSASLLILPAPVWKLPPIIF